MATPPFPLLPSCSPSASSTSSDVMPLPSPRHGIYSSDPRAHVISTNNSSSFYLQVYSTSSSPTGSDQRFLAKTFEHHAPTNNHNILPPINASIQAVNNPNASVNCLHFDNNTLVSNQHGGYTSHSAATRPRLEIRRSSEPTYHMEYDAIDSATLSRSAYSSPTSMNGFTFFQERNQQLQPNAQQNPGYTRFSSADSKQINQGIQARRRSTLSQILRSNEDDDYVRDRQFIKHMNSKRQRFDGRKEKVDRDSEDGGDSCDSIGCHESGNTSCLSPLYVAPTTNAVNPSSKSSPATSDGESILGEQIPQQQILRQNKGLRHFSKQVCDKVEFKGVTTYNEVADELAEDFAAQMQEHGGQKVDQKNIRRRVYDALNVLTAMDIIEKDRKEIRWLGLPDKKSDSNLTSSSSVTTEVEIERQKSEIRELERQNRYLNKQVDDVKITFQDKMARYLNIRNLLKRNKQRNSPYRLNRSKSDKELYLPFKLIHCTRGTIVETRYGQDGVSQILSFHPHKPNIIDCSHILQYIGMDRITPEDMQRWVNPEHLKWIITKQGKDGDYRISCQ